LVLAHNGDIKRPVFPQKLRIVFMTVTQRDDKRANGSPTMKHVRIWHMVQYPLQTVPAHAVWMMSCSVRRVHNVFDHMHDQVSASVLKPQCKTQEKVISQLMYTKT